MKIINYSFIKFQRKKISLYTKFFVVSCRLKWSREDWVTQSLPTQNILDQDRARVIKARTKDALVARQLDLIAAIELLEGTRRAFFGLENIQE